MSKALKWLDYCGYADLVTFLHLGADCPGVVWLGAGHVGGGTGVGHVEGHGEGHVGGARADMAVRRGWAEDLAEGEVNDLNLHKTEQTRKEHYN